MSLREAILAANAGAAADTINFSVTGTINLTATGHVGQLAIEKNLTITGPGAGLLSIKAYDPDLGLQEGNGERVFDITSTGALLPLVQISGVTLLGGDVGQDSPFGPEGGAIRSKGLLTLIECTIKNNSAERGGAVFVQVAPGGTGSREVLKIEDSIIQDNFAISGGGQVAVVSGDAFTSTTDTISITRTKIEGYGFDVSNGGGIYAELYGAKLTISDSTIANNYGYSGGGVYVFEGNHADPDISREVLRIENSLIDHNKASGAGGGVYVSSGTISDTVIPAKDTVYVSNTTMSRNFATFLGGGGMYATLATGSLTITDCNFSENICSGNSGGHGGGLAVKLIESATLLVDRCEIKDNTVFSGDGGGIWVHSDSAETPPEPAAPSVKIANSLISGNTTSYKGGGLYSYNYDESETLVQDTRIKDNRATGVSYADQQAVSSFGGGVYAYLNDQHHRAKKPTFTISRSTVDDNKARSLGGGVYVVAREDGNFIATNSTVSRNYFVDPEGDEPHIGGGIYITLYEFGTNSVDAYLRNMTVTKNQGELGGGVATADRVNIRTRIANSIISENVNHLGTAPNNLVGRVFFDPTSPPSQTADAFQFNFVGSGSTFLRHDNGAAFTPNTTNNILNNNAPKLNPLAFRGGATPTHAPQFDSPVLDKGSKALASDPLTGSLLTTDQRGVNNPRVVELPGIGNGPGDFTVDIGAYEIGSLARVGDVRLDNLSWLRDPYSFAALSLVGEQLRPIVTQNVTTIEIVFGGPVRKKLNVNGSPSDILSTATEGNLLLELRRTRRNSDGSVDNDSVAATGFTYTASTYTAVWTFAPLVDGKYAIHLKSPTSTEAGIVNNAGDALDSNWENLDNGTADIFSDDPRRSLSDGDGGAGSDGNEFRFHFALLAGDYDGDGVVERGANSESALGDGDGDGDSGDDDDLAVGVNGNMLPLLKYMGDFKDDEILDMYDIGAWQMYFWSSNPAADLNNDNIVDGYDFLIWQNVFENGLESAWHVGNAMGAQAVYSPEDAPEEVGVAPWITNVIISGSHSLHTPFSFDTVDGSGNQLKTVPVGGADTISIVFSEEVNVSADSLYVVGLRTGNMPHVADFTYDPLSYTATWRFEGWALGDNYLLAVTDIVTDVDGNWLDGEWTNPAATTTTNAAVSEFPSGDGNPGGWFNFVVTLLPGDANLDGIVNAYDVSILSSHYGQQFYQTFSGGDFNGDGAVNVNDYSMLSNHYGDDLRTVWLLADLDGDFDVDDADLAVIGDHAGMTGATRAQGDLNGDGAVTIADLDLAYAVYGLELSIAS